MKNSSVWQTAFKKDKEQSGMVNGKLTKKQPGNGKKDKEQPNMAKRQKGQQSGVANGKKRQRSEMVNKKVTNRKAKQSRRQHPCIRKRGTSTDKQGPVGDTRKGLGAQRQRREIVNPARPDVCRTLQARSPSVRSGNINCQRACQGEGKCSEQVNEIRKCHLLLTARRTIREQTDISGKYTPGTSALPGFGVPVKVYVRKRRTCGILLLLSPNQ
ncbi:hypothetical protein BaRGS_00030931 [Batillaria attramentaria]|uniref:Uncharacterized protein n=1 Tax=Batillaria attramentaria TaxID=370345 RepID=A0ABD0JTN0_9CAEN